jgi:hypothetical protein
MVGDLAEGVGRELELDIVELEQPLVLLDRALRGSSTATSASRSERDRREPGRRP